MERRIGIGGVAATVGVDPADAVAVHLAEQRHAPGRVQDLESVVGDQHPRRHALGQAVDEEPARVPRLLLGLHGRDLLGHLGSPRRRIGLDAPVLVADKRCPHAAPVRQSRNRGPVLCGRRRIGVRLAGRSARRDRERDEQQAEAQSVHARDVLRRARRFRRGQYPASIVKPTQRPQATTPVQNTSDNPAARRAARGVAPPASHAGRSRLTTNW